MRRGNRARKPNISRILLTLLIVAVVAVILVLVLRPKTQGTLAAGTLTMSMDASCVVVRDETCYSPQSPFNSFDKVIYYCDEGSLVEEGTSVAQVYKWGYTDDVMMNLFDVQKDIFNMQTEELAGVISTDVDALFTRIDEARAKYESYLSGNTETSLVAIESELISLLEEREALLKQRVYEYEPLSKLYDKMESSRASLEEWTTVPTTPEGGIISYYVDGNEAALNTDKIGILTPSFITKLLKNNTYSCSATKDSEPLYKIVNPNSWCLAFLTDSDSPERLVLGENYTVTFKGQGGMTCDATATRVAVSDKKVINVLSVNCELGDCLTSRTAEITVTATVNGVMIPFKALNMKSGVANVELAMPAGSKLVPVEVLAVSGSSAIVRPKNAEDTIAEGQSFIYP